MKSNDRVAKLFSFPSHSTKKEEARMAEGPRTVTPIQMFAAENGVRNIVQFQKPDDEGPVDELDARYHPKAVHPSAGKSVAESTETNLEAAKDDAGDEGQAEESEPEEPESVTEDPGPRGQEKSHPFDPKLRITKVEDDDLPF